MSVNPHEPVEDLQHAESIGCFKRIVLVFVGCLVLGWLLLPESSSRPLPPRAVCMSNIHEIRMALLQYEKVHGDFASGVHGRLGWQAAAQLAGVDPPLSRPSNALQIDRLVKAVGRSRELHGLQHRGAGLSLPVRQLPGEPHNLPGQRGRQWLLPCRPSETVVSHHR